MAHPGKMLPELARHAIEAYSRVGDVVLDPMCGIGTTLVEAVQLGRDAVGVEYEKRWAELADANLALAEAFGATGRGQVRVGDARQLQAAMPRSMRGGASLVLTSPPYGSSTHGDVRVVRGELVKRNLRYSENTQNLAYLGYGKLIASLRQVFAECAAMLLPGGIAVVTARPWRRGGLLVDFPSAVIQAAEEGGLTPLQRLVALLGSVRDDQVVPHASFFQLQQVRRARKAGLPVRVIAHEDVLVFRRP